MWMLSPLELFAVKLHNLQVFGSDCMFGGALAGVGAFDGVGCNDIEMLFNSFVSASIFKVSPGG